MEGFRALPSTPAFRISNYTVSGSLLTPAQAYFCKGGCIAHNVQDFRWGGGMLWGMVCGHSFSSPP